MLRSEFELARPVADCVTLSAAANDTPTASIDASTTDKTIILLSMRFLIFLPPPASME
jgi:hypothetical protein